MVSERQPSSSTSDEQHWYWEGNVQAAVVRHLEKIGYRIDSVADTATKQQGKDIVAVSPSNQILCVSAKGFPRGTVRTNPRTQARHWFSHAVLDLVLWRAEVDSVALALALPEQTTYHNLARRVVWFLEAVNACIFWVGENGSVNVQEVPREN